MKNLIAFMLMLLVATTAVSMEVGFEVTSTLNKELVGDKTEVDLDMKRVDYNTVADFDVYGVKVSPSFGVSSFTVENYLMSFDAVGFNVGLDAQYDVVETPIGTLSAIAGYQFTSAKSKGGKYLTYIETTIDLHEYEVGGLLTTPFIINGVELETYTGFVYSGTRGHIENLDELMVQEFCYGLRNGFVLKPTENLSIDVKSKMIDETSFGVSVKYKF